MFMHGCTVNVLYYCICTGKQTNEMILTWGNIYVYSV